MLDHVGIKCSAIGKKGKISRISPSHEDFSYEISLFYLLPAAGLPADRH